MKTALALLSALALAACGGSSASAPPPVCTAGATQACYTGPAGTQGVGACLAGTRTCLPDGSAYGACAGEVVPAALEVCGNSVDDDCNGAVDDSLDEDGDGWARCEGDCDDGVIAVNPGAFDVPGNGVDDDCDGTADAAATACSSAAKLGSVSAGDLAAALDLCQATTVAPPKAQRRWGLLSAALTLADGTTLPPPADVQVGVMQQFGPNNLPLAGATMAALSTGTARAPVDPGFVDPFSSYQSANSSDAPADLLAVNGGLPPHSPACPASQSGAVVHDPVRLELRLRAPTNARGLALRYRFFATDWPGFECQNVNDVFTLQVTSAAEGLPPGGNVAVTAGGAPISVNDGLMGACHAFIAGTCALGEGPLVGTGYLDAASRGGATAWLETTAPVVGGETLTVALTIWDTTDHVFDSLVLVDGFEWRTAPTAVSTAPAP